MLVISLLSCNKDDRAEIHIPFTLENNRIIMEAKVNGQEGRFIFDSGNMHSYLNIRARGLFPVAYTKREYKGRLRTIVIYALNKISISGIEINTQQWLINHDDVLDYLKKYEGYDGLLGIRTFEGYWCELSFSANEIILYKEKPSHFTKAAPIKYLSKIDKFYLPVTIDGNIFDIAIDTGLDKGIFFPDGIARYKKPDELKKIVSLEEVNEYHLVKTDSIHILDEVYTDAFIMTNSYLAQRRNWVSDNDRGLIGVNFLKYYDLLFDYRELRKGKTTVMYYKPIVPLAERNYGFYSFLKEMPEPGILDFYVSEKGLVIISIIKDSIAYTAYGLRPDNVITKINGEPVINIPREELLDPLFFSKVTDFSVLNEAENEEIILIKK